MKQKDDMIYTYTTTENGIIPSYVQYEQDIKDKKIIRRSAINKHFK